MYKQLCPENLLEKNDIDSPYVSGGAKGQTKERVQQLFYFF